MQTTKTTKTCLALSIFLLAVSAAGYGQPLQLAPADSGISVTVNPEDGSYAVSAADPAWAVSGSLARPLSGAKTGQGRDRIGAYDEVTFRYEDGGPISGGIRRYRAKPLALFTISCRSLRKSPPVPFPAFTTLPTGLSAFSYGEGTFSPARFRGPDGSSPALLYDDKSRALILSPADNFMVARITGGSEALESGFNKGLSDLPDGFTHRTLLAFAPGINAAWDLWGNALTDLQGKRRPAYDADLFLRTLGYWTDNGAVYYYNYDKSLGYEGTLLAVLDRFRALSIPVKYLQLDSWWYEKTTVNPQGHDEGKPKNANLPLGRWNAYGGLMEYVADPFLFPEGLAGFQKKAGLPLVTHNRWVDRNSPYHAKYKISGVGAVDPRWWDMIATYLARSGVRCYEQDWLDAIYNNSPEFQTTAWAGAAFMDDMAAACRKQGLTMQYCMLQPRHYLQGSKYDNLTSVRVSSDRFERGKWRDFLFTSRLASALGEWPWVDVFMSRETENMLLATLSAGLVGIGDKMGEESPANIRRSVRADGVIVKPDRPIVPVDAAYQDPQGEGPIVAWTQTDHGPRRTLYVFAYSPRKKETTARFAPADFGVTGPVWVWDADAGKGQALAAGTEFQGDIPDNGSGYYVVAPEGISGIAFLGDDGKFVSTGKQRILSIVEKPGALTARVAFASGETEVELHGFSPRPVQAQSEDGIVRASEYDPATHRFTVTVAPRPDAKTTRNTGEPVRTATVTLELH